MAELRKKPSGILGWNQEERAARLGEVNGNIEAVGSQVMEEEGSSPSTIPRPVRRIGTKASLEGEMDRVVYSTPSGDLS